MEKVLLFFSGGNDSTLSACKLASDGYDVYLATFDNGSEIGLENVRNRATILERKFANSPSGRVHNLGVFQSASEFMRIRSESLNIPFSQMLKQYGDLNQNQLYCLNCRSAMYVIGVVIAKELGIKYIAEGARKTQMFALEQKALLERYESVLSKNDIDLILPVFDYESDYDVKLELFLFSTHFNDIVHDGTTHYESICFLGNPMDKPLTEEEVDGYAKYFDDILEKRMSEDIDKYPRFPIREKIKSPTYGKIEFM